MSRVPWPAVTVADMLESLSQLPADAPVFLVATEVTFDPFNVPGTVTTLTLKVYGGLSIRRPLEDSRKSLPAETQRLT